MTASEKTPRWEAVKLDELDAIPVAEGLVWHPIRRRLGIEAFGINAYTAEAVGSQVVEEHDELAWDGTGGHEEIYLVVNGHATFTLDGETVEAPAGTLLFIREPRLRRVAVAKEPGTLVLAVGGPRGEAYAPRAWEGRFVAAPAHRAGRYDEAIAILTAELARHPENPALLYDLACAEALGNRPLDALTHLTEAIRRAPRYAEHARTDPDFDGLRREPGFPA